MIDLVLQIIKFYLENNKKPTKNDLIISNKELLESRWNIFITIYKNADIVWNAWNVVEIENDLVSEIIENTIWALEDNRFPKLEINDIDKIKIKVDVIKNRKLLNWKIDDLNPVKVGILAIKKDYEKLAIILPNISSKLTTWKDFVKVLGKKLNEDFKEEDYIVYELETESLSNY